MRKCVSIVTSNRLGDSTHGRVKSHALFLCLLFPRRLARVQETLVGFKVVPLAIGGQ